MQHDVLTIGQAEIRGTDSNSLLRAYETARGISKKSLLQLERTRAERVVLRITQELRKRNVPL